MKKDVKSVIKYSFCILMSLILIPVLLINLVLIFKSLIFPNEIPSIIGKVPIVALSNSMSPVFKSGDLIIVEKTDCNNIAVGDIISYFYDNGSSVRTITHRVVEIKNGKYITKGDANNTTDKNIVLCSDVIGVYKSKIPFIGKVILFMSTPTGIVVFIVLPLLAYLGYEVVGRRKNESAIEEENKRLQEELNRLKK